MKAAEEMTREEQSEKCKDCVYVNEQGYCWALKAKCNPIDEHCDCRQKEAMPLPPAEGAEEITAKEYLQNKYPQMRGHLWNSNELINDDWIAEMMDEFATLHAQKIADKMVEERIILDEEMAEPVQDALYATGRFTIDECNVLTEGILMYIKERGIINLKSREK
jgi:hypothetical protein